MICCYVGDDHIERRTDLAPRVSHSIMVTSGEDIVWMGDHSFEELLQLSQEFSKAPQFLFRAQLFRHWFPPMSGPSRRRSKCPAATAATRAPCCACCRR